MLTNSPRGAFNIGCISTALIYTSKNLTIGATIVSWVTLGGDTPLSISLCMMTAVGSLLTYAGKSLAHSYSAVCLISSFSLLLIKLANTTRRAMAVVRP